MKFRNTMTYLLRSQLPSRPIYFSMTDPVAKVPFTIAMDFEEFTAIANEKNGIDTPEIRQKCSDLARHFEPTDFTTLLSVAGYYGYRLIEAGFKRGSAHLSVHRPVKICLLKRWLEIITKSDKARFSRPHDRPELTIIWYMEGQQDGPLCGDGTTGWMLADGTILTEGFWIS